MEEGAVEHLLDKCAQIRDATWRSLTRSTSLDWFSISRSWVPTLVLGVLGTVVVVLLYVFSEQTVTPTSAPYPPTLPTNGCQQQTHDDENVKIGTVNGFKELQQLEPCSKLVVYRLTGSEEEIPPTVETEQVETLDVVGPTSEGWLIGLLTSLVNVTTLTLDIDELCRAGTSEDWLELPVLHLPNVINLIIKKASMCPSFLAEWILRWELPNLKTLHIRKTDIYTATLAQLEHLANRTSSLINVHLSNVYLCSRCKVSSDLDEKICRDDLLVLEDPYDGDK